MKATETKSTAAQTLRQKAQQPFFQKKEERGGSFFSDIPSAEAPFFSPATFQPKLKVGQPGDRYEQEADATADRVVRQLAVSSLPFTGSPSAVGRPQPVQAKCAECEAEEKEEKISGKEKGIQRKPIFESEAEPAVQMKAAPGVQRQEQPEEEEPNVQEEPLQMKPIFDSAAEPPPDDETVHRTCAECAAEEEGIQKMETASQEEEPVMTQSDRTPEPSPAPDLESRLNATKGGGSPLPEDTRSSMEGAFGADFSGVRVHTDSSAVQMNRELGAQAFTHGSDIYFGSGKYDTGSSDGQRLLAHELTHTVQQEGRVRRKNAAVQNQNEGSKSQSEEAVVENFIAQKSDDKSQVIQRNGATLTSTSSTPAGPPVDPTTLPLTSGQMNNAQTQITFDNVAVPGFKLQLHRGDLYNQHKPLKRKAGYNTSIRPATSTYVNNWLNSITTDGLKNNLRTILGRANEYTNDNATYVFKLPTGRRGRSNDNPYFFGNLDLIAESLKYPSFVKNGSRYEFRRRQRSGSIEGLEVDHIVELQLANWNTETWANEAANLELLASTPNNASGTAIDASIDSKVDAFNQATSDYFTGGKTTLPEKRKAIKDRFTLIFNDAIAGNRGPARVGEHEFWDRMQIVDGEPANALEVGHLSELEEPGVVRVFARSGAIPKTFRWQPGAENHVTSDERNWIAPFEIIQKTFNPADVGGSTLGTLTVRPNQDFYRDNKMSSQVPSFIVPIKRLPGAVSVGEIDRAVVQSRLNAFFSGMEFDLLSPLQPDFTDFAPDGSLMVEGRIVTDLPLLRGADIRFSIQNGQVQIFKEFNAGEINVPAPFRVSNANLRVFVSSRRGVGIEGGIDFGINRVGEGNVTASVSTEGGFQLDGNFNFDPSLFDNARVSVQYRNEIWTVSGAIQIPAGKVRGIRRAEITVTYSDGNLAASGSADLNVPGIERGSMQVQYSEDAFSIGGSFQLSRDVPGIQNGSIEATVTKNANDESYQVTASGRARPNIPGVNSEIAVSYDNGIITAEGDLSYNRGMLSGNVHLGVTNRAVSPEGQPLDQVSEDVRVFGGGSLTLTLTPWLQATAGVRFLPNGEIEVTGRIGLPSTVDVFPRKSIERNLFRMPTLEIPIFAIPLGPRSLGLVARITGGLDFTAGIGPGQLRELYAEITYNPDHEDQTTLHGRGTFAIPADAGLTLRADLGLGLSVAIASVSGGIEIAGSLGLQGEASASVDVNWTPATGIELNAMGQIMVSPKFRFDINAFLRASLDLWITEISETWRYNLASFEWGPDIQFGVRFPIHYVEGQPFDLSFDDIEVIQPNIDIGDIATGLGREVKNRML